jgi:hypothetical protein
MFVGGAVAQAPRLADQPFPRTTGEVVKNKEQFAQRAGQLAAAKMSQQLGPLIAAAPQQAEQQVMAVAEKTRADVLAMIEAGDPFRLREGLNALGAMLPDLFETSPGQYASELDGTIDSEVDGPKHVGVTMDALSSGVIDSLTAAKQIREINSKKTAALHFRPNIKREDQVSLDSPALDMSEAVNAYLGKSGPIASADY